MAVKPSDLPDIVHERQMAARALDVWGTVSPTYDEWHQSVRQIYDLYAGRWPVVNDSDGRRVTLTEKPKVPDLIRLSAEDRARSVTATRPSLICRPGKPGDAAKRAADKRERIIGGWWDMSRVYPRLVHNWALDAMTAGLAVCKVWTDLDQPRSARFPRYYRIAPLVAYPDPIFTPGPRVDSMVVSYLEKRRTVERRFNIKLGPMGPVNKPEDIRIIEYYDDKQIVIVAEYESAAKKKEHATLAAGFHPLGCCPVVIGTRPTMDGIYHGEFDSADGVLQFWNQMMALMLDDAIRKVYPERVVYDADTSEGGPDGEIQLEHERSQYGYVQQPNQPFTNMQLVRDLGNAARAATLFPPSRSGDPNESIISAAGISATQAGPLEDVASIQRDIIAPMLEAANEIACAVDVHYGDATKTIYGTARGVVYEEEYKPSRDIGDYRKTHVVYGFGSGLDEINRNVLNIQQLGTGIISRRTAMERSPAVEDPQREEKQRLLESLDDALVAGLLQSAQAGLLDAATLARIRRMVEEDKKSLHDIVAEHLPTPPAAVPAPGTVPATAPGVPGAAEPRPEQRPLPPLEEILI